MTAGKIWSEHCVPWGDFLPSTKGQKFYGALKLMGGLQTQRIYGFSMINNAFEQPVFKDDTIYPFDVQF